MSAISQRRKSLYKLCKINIHWRLKGTYHWKTSIVSILSREVIWRKQQLLTLCEHMTSLPVFWWGLCCLYVYFSVMRGFVCLRFVSLDCSFLIVPFVLSNVNLGIFVFNATF